MFLYRFTKNIFCGAVLIHCMQIKHHKCPWEAIWEEKRVSDSQEERWDETWRGCRCRNASLWSPILSLEQTQTLQSKSKDHAKLHRNKAQKTCDEFTAAMLDRFGDGTISQRPSRVGLIFKPWQPTLRENCVNKLKDKEVRVQKKKKSKHNCINPMLGGFNPQPLSSVHEFIHRLWQEYWSYEIKALVTGQLV